MEELFRVEGIFFNPSTTEEFESACDDVICQTVSSLERTVQELRDEVEEVKVYLFPTYAKTVPLILFSCIAA